MKSGCVCVCVVVAVLASVGADAQKNIVETAVADGNFKTLAAALTEAKLVDALSGEGPFTVFAPTDTAFEAALKALGITAEELLARPDLGGILKFHVASGKVMSSDLSNGMKVPTLEGAELTVTIDGKTVKIGDATVTTADLECSNGVIHVIDKVLLPPAPALKNIVETAVANGNFKTLAAAATKANLVEALSGEGPFTVFAPTDAAFEAALKALGITAEEALALPNLADILKFHVASGKVMSSDLSNGMKVPTLEGSELTVTIDGKTVKIGDATVTTADLECSNGVIHVIDKVLLPPAPVKDTPNIVQLGEAAGNFNTLVAAVKAAGLTETLSGAGPFTVFAPTDAAFEAALKALEITAEEALALPNLGDILKFHVASGKVMSTDLSNGMKVPTLEGSELTVTIDGKTVKIGDATVTQADVEASNGVIHIIDKVLLPPSPTTTVAPGTSDGDAAGSVDAASGGSARGFGGLLLAIALLARRV